jgi:hypothetical protein
MILCYIVKFYETSHLLVKIPNINTVIAREGTNRLFSLLVL